MKKFIGIILIFQNLVCCGMDKYSTIGAIQANISLLDNNFSYRSLVEESLQGSEHSFIELTKIRFGEDKAFFHGEVLLQLVEHMGEEKVLNYIENMDEQERCLLRIDLSAGLLVTKLAKFTNQRLEVLFPKLNSNLNCVG